MMSFLEIEKTAIRALASQQCVRRCNDVFRGIYALTICEKYFTSNLVIVVVLVVESKGL